MSIEPSKEYLKKLNEKYVFVKEHSEFSTAYMNGLIDYYGNEIIPAYKNFSEVIVLENGFLKVIYNKSQYKGCSHIGILNVKGQEVYSNNECDDITYIANGLLLVKRHIGYNIASLQGKELFDNYYDYIEILENGNFLIYKNNCYLSNKLLYNVLPLSSISETMYTIFFANNFIHLTLQHLQECFFIYNGNSQLLCFYKLRACTFPG
jgi:hypothetical protein